MFLDDHLDPLPDTAVLFASYESRCLSVARDLARRRYEGNTYVLYCADMGAPVIQNRAERIGAMLSGPVEFLPVSYQDPLPAIRAGGSLVKWGSRSLIDVTCFNRGNLFPFLWASGMGASLETEVVFAYARPRAYGSWLSRDLHLPINMPGFAGALDFPRDRLLVCLVGYESDRALAVINAAEPSSVILTLGAVPTKEEFLTRNRLAVQEVHGSSCYEVIEIDVSRPDATLAALAQIVSRVGADTAVDFAPFSTKLSCLAIWGLWLHDKRIRVWNCQPKVYNVRGYSRGSHDPQYYRVAPA